MISGTAVTTISQPHSGPNDEKPERLWNQFFRQKRYRGAVGQPYEVRLLSFKALKEPVHRTLNPFASISTYEEGDLAWFKTGAIIHHIAEQHAGLLPKQVEA